MATNQLTSMIQLGEELEREFSRRASEKGPSAGVDGSGGRQRGREAWGDKPDEVQEEEQGRARRARSLAPSGRRI
jgi:hypothetical protein